MADQAALSSVQHDTPAFWVEKTIVKGRPDRQSGPHALGRALWSPQKDKRNGDIYWAMREVKPGDIVFHLIDNKLLAGFSRVASKVDTSFVGLAHTEWAGQPGYRVALESYHELKPPIDRKEFLGNSRYASDMRALLPEKNVFFNTELNLNQGAYLTRAPMRVVQIWNEIQARNTGAPINASWGMPSATSSGAETRGEISVSTSAFDASALSAAIAAIEASHLLISREFIVRLVASLAAKPFVILTGNSGTGKTRLAQALAQWLTRDSEGPPPGYAVVPVGADWTDNRNVVGFVNYLRQDNDGNPLYQGTRVLDLILRAHEHPNEPFFLILDEMNLSHVERYFADFLSAMESNKNVPLHAESGVLKTPDGTMVARDVGLPDNLFIIGTVNVDETTYMFSPKVLDRANVLEFRITRSDAAGFLRNGATRVGDVESAAEGVGEAFVNLCRNARQAPRPSLALARSQSGSESLDQCKRVLEELLDILSITHQEFAFRTMAEIIRYVHVDFELSAERGAWEWDRCMDIQILQKILPKLHGSRKKIGSTLLALAKYCESGSLVDAVRIASEGKSPDNLVTDVASARFPLSHGKLTEMIRSVLRDQFVSFIQ